MDGVSVDQVAASVLGAKSQFPSLQLGVDGGAAVGDCDSGYSCAYAQNISWAGAQTPLPKLTDPQTIFDRLFAGSDATLTPDERARRLRYKVSVLDYVLDDAASLRGRMGPTDRHKLDEFMTGVRGVEQQLLVGQTGTCKGATRPATLLDYPSQVKVLCDLMTLALQCDLTRVITFMIGNAASGRTYEHIGIPDAHHELSHHMGDPVKLDKLTRIDTWEIAQLAYLCGRMDAIKESNGLTLLDNSLVYCSGEIEDGNTHSHLNMPVAFAGSAGGAWKTGRHLRYTQQESFGSLYVSVLQALGVPGVTRFGLDGKGPLAQVAG